MDFGVKFCHIYMVTKMVQWLERVCVWVGGVLRIQIGRMDIFLCCYEENGWRWFVDNVTKYSNTLFWNKP